MSADPLPQIYVSVIGFAGWIPDDVAAYATLDAAFYERMVAKAEQLIYSNPTRRVALASGGAAWADHVAVTLFLRHPTTTTMQLYAPCSWDAATNRFKAHTITEVGGDEVKLQKSTEAAEELNSRHEEFSAAIGRDTRAEIGRIATLCDGTMHRCGVINVAHPGFKARDIQVARHADDLLFAFSWVRGPVPLFGGTLHTWEKAEDTMFKYHVSLYELVAVPE
jgi:hypothetical protein